MKLKRLKIQNILAFEDREFDFSSRNLTFIIGKNGSGKSSIVDCIHLALFRKPIRIHVLSSILHENKTNGYVELEFEIDGNTYLVSRKFSKSNKKSSKSDIILKNGKEEASGPSTVTTYIENLLGDKWITLIPQRKLLDIIDNFKQITYNIFEIDKLVYFIKASNKLISSLKTKHTYKVDELQKYLDQKHNIVKEIQTLDINIDDIKRERDDLNNKYSIILNELNNLDELKLSSEISDIKYKINEVENNIKLKNTINPFLYLLKTDLHKNLINDIHKNSSFNKDEISVYFKVNRDKIHTMLNKLRKLNDDLTSYMNIKSKYKDILYLQKLYDQYHQYDFKLLISKINVPTVDKHQVVSSVIKLLDFIQHSNIPVHITYTVTDNSVLIDNNDKKISKDDIDIIQKYISYTQTKKSDISITEYDRLILNRFTSWIDVKQTIDRYTYKLKDLISRLSYISLKADKLLPIYTKLYNIVNKIQFDHISDYDTYVKHRQYYDDIMQLKQLGFSNMSHFKEFVETDFNNILDEYKKKLNRLQDQLNDIRIKRNKYLSTLDQIKSRLSVIDITITKYDSLTKQLDNIELYIQTLDNDIEGINQEIQKTNKILDIYTSLQSFIISRFKYHIPMIVNDMLQRFGFDFTISISSDLDIIIHTKNERRLPVSMLSGAQQSILALAIRYALSRIIDLKLPFIMDEVTEGFDNDRIDLLHSFIVQLALHKQIIVISHDHRIISNSIGSIISLDSINEGV